MRKKNLINQQGAATAREPSRQRQRQNSPPCPRVPSALPFIGLSRSWAGQEAQEMQHAQLPPAIQAERGRAEDCSQMLHPRRRHRRQDQVSSGVIWGAKFFLSTQQGRLQGLKGRVEQAGSSELLVPSQFMTSPLLNLVPDASPPQESKSTLREHSSKTRESQCRPHLGVVLTFLVT